MVVFCCGKLLSNVPLSMSCDYFEAIGGTVYIIKLEKDDLIDGKHHQEGSLENNWKARHEIWPLMFFLFCWKIWFLRKIIHCVLSFSLVNGFLRMSPRALSRLMSTKNWRKLHWIRKFISRRTFNKKGLTILPW